MQYTSDWMSISEACAHIQRVAGCDAISAFKQLREAYHDGKIRTDRQWKISGRDQLKILRRDVLKIWPIPDEERHADDPGTESNGVEAPLRQHGPKPEDTGFTAADKALCPTIDEMVKSGEARSVIAAARILVKNGRVATGGGTPESCAVRLARSYPKWKVAAETSEG